MPERSEQGKEVREKKEKRVILEIGCGDFPYFIEDREEIKENEHYIGVDPLITDDKTRQSLDTWVGPNGQFRKLVKGEIEFLTADGRKLPFEKDFCDEVVFKRTLGAPGNYFAQAMRYKTPDCLSRSDKLLPENIDEICDYIGAKLTKLSSEDYAGSLLEIGMPLWMAFNQEGRNIDKVIKRYGRPFGDTVKSHIFNALEYFQAEEIKDQILEEAHRVLKTGGDLKIIEKGGGSTGEYAYPILRRLRKDPRFQLVEFRVCPNAKKSLLTFVSEDLRAEEELKLDLEGDLGVDFSEQPPRVKRKLTGTEGYFIAIFKKLAEGN